MSRLANTAAWLLSGTLFLTIVTWSNLSGLGLGAWPLTYDDVALPRFAIALAGGAAVWLALAVMLHRGNTLLTDPTWWVLGGLGAWAIVSAAAAGTPLVWLGQSERLEGAVTVVFYAVLFGAGLQLGRSMRVTQRIAGSVVAGAAVLSVFGLAQVAKLDHTNYAVSGYDFYMGSAFATLGNPNFLAGVLVLALPVAIGLALVTPSMPVRTAWFAAAAIATAALYATYSQGAWLAAVVEIALGAGLWVRGRQAPAGGGGEPARSSRARIAITMAIVLVTGVAIIVGVTALATQRGLRLWGSSLSETSSGRILLAQTTLNAVREHPLVGYGPDDFLEAFRLHRPPRYVEVFGEVSTNNNAHSWVLQYAATLGIPGALLLCTALALGLIRSRPRSGANADDPCGLLDAAIWVGAVGFVIQMMFNAAMLASTVPFWVLLGAISACRARKRRLPGASSLAVVVLCGTLLAVAVVGSFRLLAADATYLSSRLAYFGDVPGDPVSLAEKASRLNPLSVKYSRAIAQSRGARVFAAVQEPTVPDERVRTLYAEAHDAYDRTLALAPNDYAALSWLAGLQAATGSRLKDAELTAAARESAARAAALDLTHWNVVPISKGDTSASAIRLAESANPLP